MSAFYKIAGAVLPPLVGCALAAFSVAIIVECLRALADVFLDSPRIRKARCVAAEMRERSIALYNGMCRPVAGRFTLAVELWEFADRIDRALGARALPVAPWRGWNPATMAGRTEDKQEFCLSRGGASAPPREK